MPKLRVVSRSVGGSCRQPSTTLSRIGKKHPSAMMTTFIEVPRPNRTIATGISAVAGMARTNSKVGGDRLVEQPDLADEHAQPDPEDDGDTEPDEQVAHAVHEVRGARAAEPE